MNKGVRSAQNVTLLKWAQYYGIAISWNLIWGFPGESEEDYVRQADLVPHLVHLRPPSGAGRVWLERFSPMFTEPDRFPTKYRPSGSQLRLRLPGRGGPREGGLLLRLRVRGGPSGHCLRAPGQAVEEWRRAWTNLPLPSLTYRSSPDFLQIYDARRPGHEGTYTYRGQLAQLYSALSHRPMTATAVRDRLGLTWPVEAVIEALSAWEADGLVFRDDDRAVALALPATPLR